MEVLPVVFEDRKVRRVLHDGEWYFAVADVVTALTENQSSDESWDLLKAQELAVCGVDLSELCRRLEVEDADGRKSREEAATLEGIFRVVQSIASPKAEVLKRWLARVGQEREIRHGYKTDLDTIFAMLGEAATDAIVNRQDDHGVDDGGVVCKGKQIADEAREMVSREGKGR
jgi:hypothetical protein